MKERAKFTTYEPCGFLTPGALPAHSLQAKLQTKAGTGVINRLLGS